jgi:hypothetical protein
MIPFLDLVMSYDEPAGELLHVFQQASYIVNDTREHDPIEPYPSPVHEQKVYARLRWAPGDLPAAERVVTKSFLSVHPRQRYGQQDRFVKTWRWSVWGSLGVRVVGGVWS